jgi:hypothetical protein
LKKIVISPHSRPLRNGKRNAKDYPYWPELVNLLLQKSHEVVQVGTDGEEVLPKVSSTVFGAPLAELKELVSASFLWISVDNFFPHFCTLVCHKPGIVVWSKSDPSIFGYLINLNLLKSRDYLKPEQFRWWEDEPYDENAFVSPEIILEAVESFSYADSN